MTRNKEPDNGLMTLKSNYSVRETAVRLETALKRRGLRLFARIDHSAAAEAGREMKPTEVVLFGNPAIGTPMMQAAPTLAIDLPFKGLVWEDSSRQVWLTYDTPEYLANRHHVPKSLAGELSGLPELMGEIVK